VRSEDFQKLFKAAGLVHQPIGENEDIAGSKQDSTVDRSNARFGSKKFAGDAGLLDGVSQQTPGPTENRDQKESLDVRAVPLEEGKESSAITGVIASRQQDDVYRGGHVIQEPPL
jgi:hypothetical protein